MKTKSMAALASALATVAAVTEVRAEGRMPVAVSVEGVLGSGNPYAHEVGVSFLGAVQVMPRRWLSVGVVVGRFQATGNDGERLAGVPVMGRVALRYPRWVVQPWGGLELGLSSMTVRVGSGPGATVAYDHLGLGLAGVVGLDVVPSERFAVGLVGRMFRDDDQARMTHVGLRAELRF
ncbi:MAG: hypothetical protein JNK72_26465 [Myxococcales bacterium]|nr:hypothetical protein [Myxococcales bacterium]